MAELSFGEWLKRRRKAGGLTQAQLALQIGCSTIALRKIEAEERRPSAQIVEQLASIFNIRDREIAAFLKFARGDWQSAPATPAEDRPWQDSRSRSHLPNPMTSFVGREKELQEIGTLFSMSRLITLTGPGGVGKTRLALQIARQRSELFADGVCFVDLGLLAEPELVSRALAGALGIQEVATQPLLGTLARFLEFKSLLVVLDNCEHLVKACAQLVDSLLRTCSRLKILATSREPLHTAGEMTWQVSSLSLPNPQRGSALDELNQCESIQLFVERAGFVLPSFHLTEQNAGTVSEICFRLDGIPLALELAAANVHVLAVDQILARLDNRFELLTHGNRTVLDRQQTLRGTIDWSYNLLSEAERVLFRRLAVFVGSCNLQEAETVCADETFPDISSVGTETGKPVINASSVLEVLGRLVDKSLVIVDKHEREYRYRMLETIREYGRERLERSGEATQIHARHRDWYIALVEQVNASLGGLEQGAWLNRLDVTHSNVRAVLGWCIGYDIESGLRLGGLLWQFWMLRGYLAEGREWLNRLLRNASGPILLQAQAIEILGNLDFRLFNVPSALDCWSKSLSTYLRLGDAEASSRVLQNMSGGLIVMDDLDQARRRLAESLQLAEDAKCAACRAISLHFLGVTEAIAGEQVRAQELFEQGLQLLRGLPDVPTICSSFVNIRMPTAEGVKDRPQVELEETILQFREIGTKAAIGYMLANIGQLARRQGNYMASREVLEQSLAQFRDIGDQLGISQVLGQLGNLMKVMGDLSNAHRLLRQSLALRVEVGDRRGIGRTLHNLAAIAILQDDLDGARAILSECTELFQTMGDRPGIAANLTSLGNLSFAEGDYDRAEALYSESIAIYKDLGPTYPIGIVLLDQALCAREIGDKARERSYVEAGLSVYQRLGYRREMDLYKALLADFDREQGNAA